MDEQQGGRERTNLAEDELNRLLKMESRVFECIYVPSFGRDI